MSGQVPEIFWYLLLAGTLAGTIGYGLYVATIAHRRNMKALEVLKTYAEKGADPPASVVDELAKQTLAPRTDDASKFQSRSAVLRSFIGFLFSACVTGGLHYWLADTEGPAWAIATSRAAMAFFGFGAFGLLLASLFAREK
jgi:hypothetical protein